MESHKIYKYIFVLVSLISFAVLPNGKNRSEKEQAKIANNNTGFNVDDLSEEECRDQVFALLADKSPEERFALVQLLSMSHDQDVQAIMPQIQKECQHMAERDQMKMDRSNSLIALDILSSPPLILSRNPYA